jgi:hypothetical protein
MIVDIKKPFVVSIESHGVKYQVEFPHSDVSSDEVLEVFVNLMRTAGFPDLRDVMMTYLEEHYPQDEE